MNGNLSNHNRLLQRPQKRSPAVTAILYVISAILFLGVLAVLLGMVVEPVISMEHFNRVYTKALSVTATVTSYGSYDDEGDTDYLSYISYQVDGVQYSDIRFEDEDTKAELSPIGARVKIQVSPEDPSKLISSLEGSGRILIFSVPIMMLFLSWVISCGIILLRSKANCGTPERETITRDLVLTIRSRMSRYFFFLAGCGLFLLCWRYPVMFGIKTMIAGALCGFIWLWCVVRDIREIRLVKQQEYELRRDELVRKEYIPDSDGDTYRLYYKSGDSEWSSNVSKRYFESVSEGSRVLAVYIPGRKKPLLHYDLAGNAG